ncbi:MAG: SDR family NAD(P)-dependent oxidoreductase [Pirellula sp.]
MARRKLAELRVVLTGASSGIGYHMALQLVQSGAHVLATARREDKLQRLQRELADAPGSLSICPGDITLTSHRLALMDWCQEHWQSVDVLINNAGAGAIGSFANASSDRLRRVMEIDFFAPVELTRTMLPLLRCGMRPAILNIGSVLGHRAVPNKSEYCAAKFAMRGWSEAIRVELAPERIEVLMVSPSTTRSEFFDSLLDTSPENQSRSLGSMSPEAVARIAIASLVRSKRERIMSFGGRALVWLGRMFPSLTDRLLQASLVRGPSQSPRD